MAHSMDWILMCAARGFVIPNIFENEIIFDFNIWWIYKQVVLVRKIKREEKTDFKRKK